MKPVWFHAREVVRKFGEDNCSLIAAAVSFFAFLSVIPLMLLGVAVLGFVLTGERAQEVVLEFSREQLPGLEREVAEELRTLIEAYQWTGGLSLLGLLWAGSHVFLNLEIAMNLAWHVREHRSLLHRRLLALLMVPLAGVPLVLSLALTIGLTAIREWTVPVFGWELKEIPLVWGVLSELTPVLLSVLSFTAIYRWIPNCPVQMRPALLGGVCGGLLWEVAKRAFAFYTASLAQFGRVYGPFAGLIGLMLWIYYSTLVLLLGAEIAAIAQSVHPLRPEGEGREAPERLREAQSSDGEHT